MLSDMLLGKGHTITSAVCWPKTHSLRRIRRKHQRSPHSVVFRDVRVMQCVRLDGIQKTKVKRVTQHLL